MANARILIQTLRQSTAPSSITPELLGSTLSSMMDEMSGSGSGTTITPERIPDEEIIKLFRI